MVPLKLEPLRTGLTNCYDKGSYLKQLCLLEKSPSDEDEMIGRGGSGIRRRAKWIFFLFERAFPFTVERLMVCMVVVRDLLALCIGSYNGGESGESISKVSRTSNESLDVYAFHLNGGHGTYTNILRFGDLYSESLIQHFEKMGQ